MDYIAGYTIFNDITARDIQRREMRSGVFSFCKAIDTFCPLGPWIVTPDEVGDPHDLDMELRVNGELRQESALGQHVADDPGDPRPLLGARLQPPATSSRPARSPASPASARMRPSLYLRPGDVIEGEIERIGVLSQSGHLLAGGPRRAGSAAAALVSAMGWPLDTRKLERVRALMGEAGLDTLVVRAPDNVLYLTNFWRMKGYDVASSRARASRR